jgi:ectoine hydroxylase-related dioxygenase (phytanoyl-CoA dioxygenase family)
MSRPSLAAAHHLMGEIRVFSLNGRNPAKGMGQQALHSDVTRLHPGDWRLVNTMIMVDDLTDDNGPTRLVPGSHKLPPLNVPDGNLVGATRPELTDEERSLQPIDSFAEHPREVKVTGSAGSVCVINGCIWHGGTRNRSGAQRRLLHMAIGRRDLPAHHDHRGTLTPALRRRATPAVSYLLDIVGAEAKREDYILP